MQAERKRRAEKKKRKEENELRAMNMLSQPDPRKLARMSKKQFLNAVHNKNRKK